MSFFLTYSVASVNGELDVTNEIEGLKCTPPYIYIVAKNIQKIQY